MEETATVTRQELELIKTRTIFLCPDEESGEIILVDAISGDMFFTFLLKYIKDEKIATTSLQVKDEYHALVVVETRPHAVSCTKSPMWVGSYGDNRPLFIEIRVEPCVSNGEHECTISFYQQKNI